MKTIRELRQEMNELNTRITVNTGMKTREKNACIKQIMLLRTMIRYLETYPTEAYLQQAIDQVEQKITNRMLGFEPPARADQQPKSFLSNLKTAWEKANDIPHLREQVRTLRYLLK